MSSFLAFKNEKRLFYENKKGINVQDHLKDEVGTTAIKKI